MIIHDLARRIEAHKKRYRRPPHHMILSIDDYMDLMNTREVLNHLSLPARPGPPTFMGVILLTEKDV